MKFSETMMYDVLQLPGRSFDADCGYIFALKFLPITLMMVIFIVIAVIVDLKYAITHIY